MSYPSFGGTGAATNAFPGTTTHLVEIPLDIAAGDLLIEYFSYRKDTPTPVVTWPAGWTVLFATSVGTFDTLYQEVRYRVCDGSEVNFNLTTSVTVLGNTRTVRLLAGSYTGVPEFAMATNGATAAPQPPLLAPTWGEKHTFWLASAACHGSDTTFVKQPGTDLLLGSFWAFDVNSTSDFFSSFPTGCAVVGRQATVASLTPPAFATVGTNKAIMATIAVQGTATALGLVIAEVTSKVEPADVVAATLVMPSAGAVGDTVFATIAAPRNGGGANRHSFVWPAAFTLVANPTAGDPETLLDVYYRILDGTEPATYTIPYANPAFTNRRPSTLVVRIPGAAPPYGVSTQVGNADPLPYPTHVAAEIPALWLALFGVPTGIWHSSLDPGLNLIPPFKHPSPGYTMGATLHGTASTLGSGVGFQAKIGTLATETPGATDLRGAQHFASVTIGVPLAPPPPTIVTPAILTMVGRLLAVTVSGLDVWSPRIQVYDLRPGRTLDLLAPGLLRLRGTVLTPITDYAESPWPYPACPLEAEVTQAQAELWYDTGAGMVPGADGFFLAPTIIRIRRPGHTGSTQNSTSGYSYKVARVDGDETFNMPHDCVVQCTHLSSGGIAVLSGWGYIFFENLAFWRNQEIQIDWLAFTAELFDPALAGGVEIWCCGLPGSTEPPRDDRGRDPAVWNFGGTGNANTIYSGDPPELPALIDLIATITEPGQLPLNIPVPAGRALMFRTVNQDPASMPIGNSIFGDINVGRPDPDPPGAYKVVKSEAPATTIFTVDAVSKLKLKPLVHQVTFGGAFDYEHAVLVYRDPARFAGVTLRVPIIDPYLWFTEDPAATYFGGGLEATLTAYAMDETELTGTPEQNWQIVKAWTYAEVEARKGAAIGTRLLVTASENAFSVGAGDFDVAIGSGQLLYYKLTAVSHPGFPGAGLHLPSILHGNPSLF